MAKLEMELPAFVKGHTPWNPKARVKDGVILVKCGDHGKITAPHTGKPKDDQKATADAIRVYAKAHGWSEVA